MDQDSKKIVYIIIWFIVFWPVGLYLLIKNTKSIPRIAPPPPVAQIPQKNIEEKISHCRSCGAPLNGSRCDYCGSTN